MNIKIFKIVSKIRNSFFAKLLLFFCIIMTFILAIFSITISSIVTKSLKEKHIAANNIVLDNVYDYFSKKYKNAYKIFETVYVDSTLKKMLFDLAESSKLDYFTDIPFEQKEIVNKLNSMFQIDDDMITFSFYKMKTDQLYIFSKKNGTFSEGISVENIKHVMRGIENNNLKIFIYELKNLRNQPDKMYGIIFSLPEQVGMDTNASIMVSFSIASIEEICKKQLDRLDGNILIFNKQNEIIFDSSGKYYFRHYPYIDELRSGSSIIKIDDEPNLVSHIYNSGNMIDIYQITPITQINNVAKTIEIIIFLLCIILIIIGVLVYGLISKIFIKVIKNVISVMNKVKAGDTSARIKIDKSHDEIAQISESFNNMCDNLIEQINRRMLAQEKQKTAEILSLQSKINPHFIYNTLEAIRIHAADCQNGEIAEMIQTFSEIFRETIREGSFTEVADEFESCKTYTDLFMIKYGHALNIDYSIEQEVYRYGIIRKVLQPILENYFIHGYDRAKSDNHIRITAKMDFDDIVINVRDNGLGITEEKVQDIRDSLKKIHLDSKTSIGISNVNDRIKLIYGNSYGVGIESILNQYTLVTIRVKAKTKDELEKFFQQPTNVDHL